jgi:hypothetical protein
MASNITFNGVTYSIPAVGDDGWGSDLSAYFIAIASGALQKTGGNFTLTAEADFGATFGLKSAYLKSQAANPASAGIIRLGNNENISWRNFANSADLSLKVNASNALEFNGAAIISGNIVNSMIDAAAAIALSKLATVTASRVLVSDVSGIITASAVTTTTLAFLDATSSIQTQLDAKASSASLTSHTSATTSVHGIADTSLLITTTGAQVITNKDFDGGTASNTSRITVPKASKATLDALTRKEATVVYASDTDKLYYDDGSILKLVGSGSGGAVNFISDGDAEGSNIWTAYADAAGTRPVDGTGGSPTVTATISSTTPLAGTNSFLLTKDAANRQGQGIATTFSVDLAYRAKVVQIEFDYLVSSGTFVAGSSSADSDVIAYIYDVTNSTLIEPSSIKLLSNSSTLGDKFIANFQTSATGASYRLILHCATTSASAYTLKLDSVRVGPCNYVYGTPITDDTIYTPTTQGFGTVSASNVKWSRRGDKMLVYGRISTGTPTAVEARINLPSGYTIDSAKITGVQIVGSWLRSLTDVSTVSYYVLAQPGLGYVNVGRQTASANPINVANGNEVSDPTSLVSFMFEVPITGWSSSTQVSDGYDSRQIGFRANNSSTTINATPAKIVWTNTDKDDVAGYSSGTYTVRSAGWYDVAASLYISGTPSVDQTSQLFIYRNGAAIKAYTHRYKVASATTTSIGPVADSFYFNAGDTVEIYASSEITTPAISSSTTLNTFFIGKRQSPTTISATELVSAIYGTTSQSITNGGTRFIVNASTLVEDTFNAVTTGASWKFTAPMAGLYEIKYVAAHSSVTLTTGASLEAEVYKNGVLYKPIARYAQQAATAVSPLLSGAVNVRLNSGDYVDVREAVGGSVSATISDATIYIARIK